ncbi:protein P200-like [Ruditapes philippinarum]|uniref:protein P200-like n=1 Tax=Ruditapes philippinarum TaxID=129788 RepID=UPI00295BD25D|nr:protein P200-like [Ruditapes philippinarum]
MSQDQVVSVRLRRNTTSTPWGFRMQGGHEYGSHLFIQQVNPKSLSHRLGLRVGDRLLAIGSVQAHNMSHEMAKMEIIRAGNELDLIVQRDASAAVDQLDSRQAYNKPQRTELVEEPTEYRGYTNPNVQSRSFKILQESLSYSEANEEGIVLPTGNTPGEGIVRMAYSEGRRRLEELSEINPRNFTEEGQSPYKVTEHYNIKEESLISEPDRSVQQDPNVTVVAAKTYDGSEPRRRKRPTPVDIAQSSVLSPAAGQQQYLQQAKEHYQTKQEYTQQHHEKSAPQPQQVIVHQRRSPEKPLKLVNYQFDEQYSHLRKESNRQKAVVSPQKSNDFIPATETVSSVAADLDLKIVSPSAAPQQTFEVRQTTRTVANQNVRPAAQAQTVKPIEQRAQPTSQVTKPVQQVAKPVESTVQPAKQVVQPAEQTVKPVEQTVKPSEQVVKPTEQVVTKIVKTVETVEETIKPEKQIVRPSQDVGNVTEVISSQTVNVKSGTDESLTKFAESLSASVVASAQETIKTTSVTEKTVSENVDGCLVSKESTVQLVEENVAINTKQESESLSKQEEEVEVESKQAVQEPQKAVEEESQSKQITGNVTKEEVVASIETSVKKEIIQSEVTEQKEAPVSTVVVEEIKTMEDMPETIQTATIEKPQEEIDVNIEASTNVSEQNVQSTRRPSLLVPETDTEINVSAHNTEEQTSVTVEETSNEFAESKSEDISISSQIEAVITSDENIVENTEQTINIVTDTQAEEQSFSISVGETDETSEVVEMTIDTNEASESNASFEISTDAEVTMDISTEVDEEVKIENNADADAAVTLSVGQDAEESESTFTVSVTEEDDDGSSEVSKPKRKITEPTENGQNKPKPSRAKFVDSQGGVAARLARFKQK